MGIRENPTLLRLVVTVTVAGVAAAGLVALLADWPLALTARVCTAAS